MTNDGRPIVGVWRARGFPVVGLLVGIAILGHGDVFLLGRHVASLSLGRQAPTNVKHVRPPDGAQVEM